MRARFLSVVAAALLTVALVPLDALADGDPASDILLGQNVFYPYTPPVSASLTKALNAQTSDAARAGFPVKVALIASPVDLGVIPDLFNKPQKYADFLDIEISFQTKQPLLVVMPAGLGGAALGAPATRALSTLAKPSGKQSNYLAQAAIPAVARLAAAAGHPLKDAPAGRSSGSGGSSTVLLVALVLAAIATAGALLAVRRRRIGADA